MLALAKQTLWYLTVAFFFSNVVAQMLFVYTKPRIAAPSLGRVYPLNVHGTIVYLTYAEHLVASFDTFLLAGLFGVSWALLDHYARTHT